MLIQKNSKKTIAISEAISTFTVLPSMYFHLYLFCEKFQLQTVHNWLASISVKVIQSVAMSFSVNL